MSAQASSIQVKIIDHITLVVKDLEKSKEFYVDTLGMEQVQRPAFKFDGRWFQLGDQQIHLILEHDLSGPAGFPKERGTSRTHHFAFEVDDCFAAYEVLNGLGASIVHEPKNRPDGAVQMFVADPDGHVVELCSAP